jgi:8-oxo-dGTP diphosphatase
VQWTRRSSLLSPKTVNEPASMNIAVSTVIFALRPDENGELHLWIPMVRRTRRPYEGRWALPGGWVGNRESLTDAAGRTLRETTGLRPRYLEQLYTFGHPERSMRSNDGRVISVVYSALVRSDEAEEAQEDENVRWFNVDALPELAFDHDVVVDYALSRLRNKIEYANVAFFFLGETFSLSQLREVYEAILQKRLDPANFRRQIEASGTIVQTAERLTGGRHRPPRLYRCEISTGTPVAGPAA